MDIDRAPAARIDYLADPLIDGKGIRIGVLRLDEIHPVISGNKWFKLQEYLEEARRSGKTSLLTFGGAHSNHLLATAAAAKAYGLSSSGIVRGLHGAQNLTATLRDCMAYGMALQFVSRETYAGKNSPAYLDYLGKAHPEALLVPEGGSGKPGIAGAGRIAGYIPPTTAIVACAIGTATTFAGIRQQLPPQQQMLGFTVMKGGAYLEDELLTITDTGNWQLNHDYHFGGFARHKAELVGFMNQFYGQYSVPLDFVYTGKMMYGLWQLVAQDYFPRGTEILCVHSGGLQGNRSIGHLLAY